MTENISNDDIEETGATETIGIVDEPLVKEGEDLLKIKRDRKSVV